MKRNELLNLTDEDVFDPFFGAIASLFGTPAEERYANRLLDMRSDITDEGDHYLITVDLPGVKKEDVKLSLEDGYLNIRAEVNACNKEKEHGKFLRKERYCGSVSRSFYVGDIDQRNIGAKMENGSLLITLPKEDRKVKEEKHLIAIE